MGEEEEVKWERPRKEEGQRAALATSSGADGGSSPTELCSDLAQEVLELRGRPASQSAPRAPAQTFVDKTDSKTMP